jgi:probable HAF family extracellular repeat protein
MKVTDRQKILVFMVIIIMITAFSSTSTFAQAQYQIIDLGTLSGFPESEAIAINDNGQVIGSSFNYSSNFPDRRAFSWTQAGGMVDIGTLGGSYIQPTALNNNGQVVGFSTTTSNPNIGHAFLWTQAGGMIDLGTLGGNFTMSGANAINSSGQVAGYCITSDYSAYRAFFWTQASGMIDLGTLGGNSWSVARAMNDNGQVVGESNNANGKYHAFSWTQEEGMIDLGTLGGTFSCATAVNNKGQVVGYSSIAGDRIIHAFSWTREGGMIDLGTLGNYGNIYAVAVNDNGQAVGYTDWYDAFSWTQMSGMVDLGHLGIEGGSVATAVNASGQVVGYAEINDPNQGYCQHGFSWTQEGGMIDLGSLIFGYPSRALAINKQGLAAGVGFVEGYFQHAVIWQATDTTAPSLAPVADRTILWPPNRKMAPVTIKANASDKSGMPVTLNATVSCNESQNGAVYWTTPFIDQATGTIYLQLQADRLGKGSGRIYTITIAATDQTGNVGTASVQIMVPHDQGKN